MAEAPDPKRGLVIKLAEVMKAVHRVPKRGRNDFHNYDYATEADIAEVVRTELSDRNIMLIPQITGEERHPVGEKGSWLTVLAMSMEFIDGDTDQRIQKSWRGYGTDKEDKGGYKAITGATKYFLLKTFLMPTGDDPEQETTQAKPQRTVKARPAPEPVRLSDPEALLSGEQVAYIVSAAEKAERGFEEMRAYLKRTFGYIGSKDIKQKDYRTILAAIAKPGELP